MVSQTEITYRQMAERNIHLTQEIISGLERGRGSGRESEIEEGWGWGSPSAVSILEVSVVESVGMVKTKYSSRGRAAGKKTKCRDELARAPEARDTFT